MLLTGRRLKQVVEGQVEARLSADRRTEREILRYVATGHSAGVAILAEVLESLLPGEDLTPALAVLDSEHLVVADDGNRWRGLHELRSEVARDYLHQFPPPTASTTVRHLVENLPVDDTCRIIEMYARLDADLVPAAEAVAVRLRSPDIRAKDASQLVESLAMADAIRHARACLEVIETHRPRSLDPWNAFFAAYLHRFGGVSLDGLTAIEPGFARFLDMASALPPRPSLFVTCAFSDCLRRQSTTSQREEMSKRLLPGWSRWKVPPLSQRWRLKRSGATSLEGRSTTTHVCQRPCERSPLRGTPTIWMNCLGLATTGCNGWPPSSRIASAPAPRTNRMERWSRCTSSCRKMTRSSMNEVCRRVD